MPRPYVLRPPIGAETQFGPNEELRFELVLIGRAINYLPEAIYAFTRLGGAGLGAQLSRLDYINPLTTQSTQLHIGNTLCEHVEPLEGEEVFRAAEKLPARLTIYFVTPMRLRHMGHYITTPECHVLIRAALRRISQLSTFFGDSDWGAPFDRVLDKARQVKLVEYDTHWVSGARGQHETRHFASASGFIGKVTYDFVPPPIRAVLLMGSLLNIGNGVVIGLGTHVINSSTQC